MKDSILFVKTEGPKKGDERKEPLQIKASNSKHIIQINFTILSSFQISHAIDTLHAQNMM